MTRILIVDDDPGWLQYAILELTEAHTISDGGEYDLYIVKAGLPVIPGCTLVVTNQPTNREAAQSYRDGALDYQTKNLEPGWLVGVVEELLMPTTPAA